MKTKMRQDDYGNKDRMGKKLEMKWHEIQNGDVDITVLFVRKVTLILFSQSTNKSRH